MARRLSRESWITFALIFISGPLAFSWVGEEVSRGAMFQRYSTLRAEPDGTLAFFELAKARGRKCRRVKRSLIGLPKHATVFSIQPDVSGLAQILRNAMLEPYDEKERKGIVQWVERGGHFVFLSNRHVTLLEDWGAKVQATASRTGAPRMDAVPVSLLPMTAGIKTPQVRTGSRLTLTDPSWMPLYELPSESTTSGPEAPPPGSGSGEIVAATRHYGEGRVTVLADPWPITNVGIAEPGNAEFLAALIEEGEGPVLFDEFRHGLRDDQSLPTYLRDKGLGLAIYQMLLVFALVCWASAARSGRIRAARPASGVESREFLSALAHIYGKAKLQGHAIEWFERRLVATLRVIMGDDRARYLEEFEREAVAQRLKELGIKYYQGFGAYLDTRASLFAKARGGARSGGFRDWRRVHGLSEIELLGLVRLAMELERSWIPASGLFLGNRLPEAALPAPRDDDPDEQKRRKKDKRRVVDLRDAANIEAAQREARQADDPAEDSADERAERASRSAPASAGPATNAAAETATNSATNSATNNNVRATERTGERSAIPARPPAPDAPTVAINERPVASAAPAASLDDDDALIRPAPRRSSDDEDDPDQPGTGREA